MASNIENEMLKKRLFSRSTNPFEKIEILNNMYHQKNPNLMEYLVKILSKEKTISVKKKAIEIVKSLEQLNEKLLNVLIMLLLNDDNLEIREDLARYFGDKRFSSTLLPLFRVLISKNNELKLKRTAFESIKKIGISKVAHFEALFAAIQNTSNSKLQEDLIKYMTNLNPEIAYKFLIKLIRESYRGNAVKIAILELMKIDKDEAIKICKWALQTKNQSYIREIVLRILGDLQDPSFVKLFIKALKKDIEKNVVQAAMEYLVLYQHEGLIDKPLKIFNKFKFAELKINTELNLGLISKSEQQSITNQASALNSVPQGIESLEPSISSESSDVTPIDNYLNTLGFDLENYEFHPRDYIKLIQSAFKIQEIPEAREINDIPELSTIFSHSSLKETSAGPLLNQLNAYFEKYYDFDYFYLIKSKIYENNNERDKALMVVLDGLRYSKRKYMLYNELAYLFFLNENLLRALENWIRSIVCQIKIKKITLPNPFIYVFALAKYYSEGVIIEKFRNVLSKLQGDKFRLSRNIYLEIERLIKQNTLIQEHHKSILDNIKYLCYDYL